ncbi:MAG: heavy-metal-associated domain-containing protein [Gemmatimonadetes bacterium]|nr:heavy-metal-associated domain-containing protein [Gemmatimonadota bacterium]
MKLRRRALILVAGMLMGCGGTGSDEPRGNAAGEALADSASAARSETFVLTVPSMSCPLCARSIDVRLREAGLRDIRIDLERKLVTVVLDPSRTTVAEVKALVEGQGFPVTGSRRAEGAQVELER